MLCRAGVSLYAAGHWLWPPFPRAIITHKAAANPRVQLRPDLSIALSIHLGLASSCDPDTWEGRPRTFGATLGEGGISLPVLGPSSQKQPSGPMPFWRYGGPRVYPTAAAPPTALLLALGTPLAACPPCLLPACPCSAIPSDFISLGFFLSLVKAPSFICLFFLSFSPSLPLPPFFSFLSLSSVLCTQAPH